MDDQLRDKLKTLPTDPGVYFHKNKLGEIIYVGKAAVLRNRVRQYFRSQRDMDVKTRALVAEIADTDWVVTDSEIDALFLESEMVKRYMPQYNILLRDDKSQSYVRIDMKSEWPHVSFTRNPIDDGAAYFGPFYNGYALKKALRYLRKTFPYYTKPPREGARPSLDAHIGLEPYGMTSEEYHSELRKLISYIKGNRVQLAKELEQAMKVAAAAQDFEQATILRNRLQNLQELRRRIMFGDKEFLDISKDRALAQLAELLSLESAPARIEGFDISHISGSDVVASQVVFVNGVSNRADYRKYKLRHQKNDDYASMYEVIYRRLSPANAGKWGLPDLLLIDGGKGQLAAATRAVRDRGVSIPTISIAKREEEVIVHNTQSNVNTTHIEDFIKDPRRDIYVVRSGDFYTINLHPDQLNAGSHSKNLRGGTVSRFSDLTKLFQRIRDESHRFAISYHAVLRKNSQTKSLLDDIPGIGPVTRRKLIKAFGSARAVAEADVVAIKQSIGDKMGEKVFLYLKEAARNEGKV